MNDQHPNNSNPEPNENSADDNPAIEGLLREYARTGGPGDDEQLVQSVLKGIDTHGDESAASQHQQTTMPSVQPGRPEKDWPWLFGKRFWNVTIAALLLCAIGIGGNAWMVSQAQADPTEVMLFTRPRFAPGDDARLRVLVRDGRDQSPIANAKVHVVLTGSGQTQDVGTVETDDDGIVDITAELNQQLEEGDYKFQVKVGASTGHAEAIQTITVARSFRTMLSTDKPLYQPGQTIHMRALSLNVDAMTPAPARAVEFLVRDGKGNKVFAARPTTSDFGIAAADFKLADQVNEGEYQIVVKVGDTTSERTVKVERYVLPKFRVDLKTDRNYYAPGEELTVTLDANYTFGKPTAGAEVRIDVADVVGGRNVFQTITGKTNDEGLFASTVKLKDRMAGTAANGGDAEVFFSASVTDKTGETNRKSISRIVANSPIRIEVFPESGELVPGVENTLYIMTALPDGSPVQTTVQTAAGTEIATNELGIGKVKLTPDSTGLKLTLTATDSATGLAGHAVKQLRIGNDVNNVLLRTDRAIYRQGETANLTVLSGSPAGRAFVDVIRDGRSITTAAIDLTNSQGEYALDLPPDVLGTLQVQAYCIQPSGRIARDTKVIQVSRADQLEITATLDAETYKPAEQAMINFLVKSKDGNPVAAALSLAIVDEAAFARNDARPGLEDRYFLIQEELLKPRYQFTTQPRLPTDNDLVSVPASQQQELAEAQVVRFSAANATVAEAPDEARGETINQRERVVTRHKKNNRRGLLSLMWTVPFVAFCILMGLFLLYAMTRVTHRAATVEESVASVFRSEMRLLLWMTLGAVIAIPLAIYVATKSNLLNDQWNPIWLMLTLAAVGGAMIAAPAWRLRRLAKREQFAPLFARFAMVIPTLYVLGLLGFAGLITAVEIDSNAIQKSGATTQMLGCVAGFLGCVGCLGFLRKSLTVPRSWFQNLTSFGINQLLVFVPTVMLLIPTLSPDAKIAMRTGNFAGGVETALADPSASIDKVEFLSPATEGMGMANGKAARGEQGLAPAGGASTTPPVRRFFPETLLWQPQLLTDADGTASLNVQLADSITTWRMGGSAVALDGRLGSFQHRIRVFQDFFIDIQMPVRMTQNDEISVPVSIFNYLNEPQSIALTVNEADWFELVDDEPNKSVDAAASEVMRTSFRIRVLKPGRHAMTISAQGSVLADAVERTVQVVPDGERTEVVVNGKLVGDATESIVIPPNAVAGGNDLFLKVYPGGFSQVVEGMDSIFQMPHGCFEQTSSTTYPNILVLDYLRRTKQANPDIELKALDFIATGYQRLLSFEVDGGGFDWFGNPPANEVLTAYGLHEFTDMAQVYEVDTDMIARTRRWLGERMQPDGTWTGEDLRHETVGGENSERRTIRQTAYVLWALARNGELSGLDKSIAFVEGKTNIKDAYVLALVANAMIACNRQDAARDAIARLSDMADLNQEEQTAFWTSTDDGLTYGRGDSLAIETTALVVQAMIKTNSYPRLVSQGLNWIVSKRDSRGTWHSTQATVQAMRALLMADTGGKIEQDTKIEIVANDQAAPVLTITEETGDVSHLVSLTEFVREGDNTISLNVDNDSLLAYQIVGVHYLPRQEDLIDDKKPLQIATKYRSTELSVNDLLTVDVSLTYNRPENAPMTLVDLGIPPGFEIEATSFHELVGMGVITKFEVKGQQVSLYFDSIPGAGKTTKFGYQLRAKYPVKVQAPSNVAYQYYEPEVRDESNTEILTVR